MTKATCTCSVPEVLEPIERRARQALRGLVEVARAVHHAGGESHQLGNALAVLADEEPLGPRFKRLERETGCKDLDEALYIFRSWIDGGPTECTLVQFERRFAGDEVDE